MAWFIICCWCVVMAGRLGADIGMVDVEYWGSSYGGGGRLSLAVGELLPRTMEFSEGEKIPRVWLNEPGVLPE